MRIFLLVFALLVIPAVLPAQTTTLFRNARVFDGERVLANTDVLVRAGRIAALGRNLTVPAGAEVVDASGHTLLPGFIDAHTHAFGEALRDALIFGVTTELDMFTEPRSARAARTQQAAGSANDRADLFSAGVLATAPGGHGTEYGFPIPTITRPDSAQAFVDARIAEGSDYIKIVYDDGGAFGIRWPTIDETTLRALIDAAHRRNKLAVVHVSRAATARAALAAGADGLVHLFADRAQDADFAQLASARGAFVIPTLVVLRSITGVGGGAPLVDDERIAPYLNPANRAQLTQSFRPPTGPDAPNYAHAVSTVRALHASGVPILAGTDAPNPGTAHGAAIHRELELLVEAGLSPIDALRAATSVPADRFRIADRGRIAQGKRADLVLVNGDPTTDITATRAIAGVWKGGVRADRASYARAVTQALAAAERPLQGLEQGLISDFDSGSMGATFGTAWTVTTDAMAGGTSIAEINVIDGGARSTAKSLHIKGEIKGSLPYAWAGATWSPGTVMMQPGDLSSKQEIVFQAKGDGKTYRVLLFVQSRGMEPIMHEFVAPASWTEVVVPWSTLGIDGKGVMAIMFLGGPAAGTFAFQVDDVRLR